jgi:hypothetical protein
VTIDSGLCGFRASENKKSLKQRDFSAGKMTPSCVPIFLVFKMNAVYWINYTKVALFRQNVAYECRKNNLKGI